MSNEDKSSNTANPPRTKELDVNEKILKECYNIYTHPQKGLIKIAWEFIGQLLPPRKKIVVLLIGNNSAAKSSFINWYVGERVLKSRVAIENQGICLVTSGKKPNSLIGNVTLDLYPHFKPLQLIPGLLDCLSTEISTSNQKKFSLTTFVDTPGLVDGDIHYLFDVNKAISKLGNIADLILVFFDPTGQALCKRTLDVVKILSKENAKKLNFYFLKTDDAENESDRQRVTMQIVEELCDRLRSNRTGFDMQTISIPQLNESTKCKNQIEDVCLDIEKTIHRTVQNTLTRLEEDCANISSQIMHRFIDDNFDRSYNFQIISSMVFQGSIFGAMFLCWLAFNQWGLDSEIFLTYVTAGPELLGLVFGVLYISYSIFIMYIIPTVVIIYNVRLLPNLRTTLTSEERKRYADMSNHINLVIVPKKTQLYSEYLKQSVSDEDL